VGSPISESLFDQLLTRQAPDVVPPEVATLGEALWLHSDMGPSSYLLRDGRVFVIDAFEPDAPPRLADENEIISVFLCAAENLSCPEILKAIPTRPPGASDCSQCRGARWWQLPGQWSGRGQGAIVCPRCSGRGWIGYGCIIVEMEPVLASELTAEQLRSLLRDVAARAELASETIPKARAQALCALWGVQFNGDYPTKDVRSSIEKLRSLASALGR
jgi:hypothetical protein